MNDVNSQKPKELCPEDGECDGCKGECNKYYRLPREFTDALNEATERSEENESR